MNEDKRRLVAIVGRPNVGKSALFNRLIGKRIAIVEDTPYVTRDRIYGDLIWNGLEFKVADTGGMDPGSDDTLKAAVLGQTTVAVNEADLLLFVVDQESGLTGLDIDVAEVLRKSGKPVILVANKGETKREGLLDFYDLALGEPLSVSAIHGTGTGDLLDIVVDELRSLESGEAAKPPESEDMLHLALLGRPNVGKSSILNFLAGEARAVVHEEPGTTRDAVDIIIEYGDRRIILVDTAGLRRRGKIGEKVEYFSTVRTRGVLSRSQVALLVLDASDGLVMGDKKIAGEMKEAYRGTVILVNKWDKIEDSPGTGKKMTPLQKDFMNMLGRELNFLSYAPVIFTSALKGWGLDGLLDIALEVGEEYGRKLPARSLNKVLGDAVFMNPPPPAKDGKPVKLSYISQVAVRPPTMVIRCNEPGSLQDSYLRYIENRLRAEYGLAGVPIRFFVRRK
ncbi:MAG: ribosome biogenesis GTPase Der [Chloroflexi bacterium]|nr:ribosome biogenesis GTPase Der [Chloroflexota bacterium]